MVAEPLVTTTTATQQNDSMDGLEMTALGEHVRYATLEPEGITFVELDSNDRTTMDQWVDFSAETRREWDGQTPIMVVVDTSKMAFAFSPYLMKKGAQMMQINKHAPTFIAWIVQKNFAGQLMQGMLGRGRGKSNFYVCYSREAAVKWVREEYQRYMSKQLSIPK